MKEQKNRSEIDNSFKWDLTLIYNSDDSFYKDLEQAKEEVKKISDFKDLTSSSNRLLEYINDYYY